MAKPNPTKPDCPNYEAWCGYLETRKFKKYPNTPHAIVLLVNRLLRFHGEGQDIAMMLDKATVAGWNTVYAVKGYVRHEEKPVQERQPRIATPEIKRLKNQLSLMIKSRNWKESNKVAKQLDKLYKLSVPKVGEVLDER